MITGQPSLFDALQKAAIVLANCGLSALARSQQIARQFGVTAVFCRVTRHQDQQFQPADFTVPPKGIAAFQHIRWESRQRGIDTTLQIRPPIFERFHRLALGDKFRLTIPLAGAAAQRAQDEMLNAAHGVERQDIQAVGSGGGLPVKVITGYPFQTGQNTIH